MPNTPSNIDKVRLTTLGLRNAQLQQQFWPTESQLHEAFQTHYAYVPRSTDENISPHNRYLLDITMVAGRGLVDRLHIKILQKREKEASLPVPSFLRDSFDANTDLVRKVEILLPEVCGPEAWDDLFLWDTLSYISPPYLGKKSFDAYRGRVDEEFHAARERIGNALEKELHENGLINCLQADEYEYPLCSEMMVLLFMDYRSKLFDQPPASHLKLVKTN